jgi:uncharacterized protein (TIGR01777 family)
MKIAVTGSTGLVGSALLPLLAAGGHEVRRVVRARPGRGSKDVHWDPARAEIDAVRLEGLDAVIHLAGESIASGRWTAAKKRRIRDSRVEGTQLLTRALTSVEEPPVALICASAIGYYGDRGRDVVDEDSAPGEGFLADVCREWEAAAQSALRRGIRVANLRFGVILSPAGGALATMLPIFKLGLGGVLGSGKQYVSWVALDDAVGAIDYALGHAELAGPVNVVSPNPVTNRDYTRMLGRVLSRPTIFPVPGFAARLAMGEMADELLLSSTRAEPQRLIAAGYPFRHPELEEALRHLLGR